MRRFLNKYGNIAEKITLLESAIQDAINLHKSDPEIKTHVENLHHILKDADEYLVNWLKENKEQVIKRVK